MTRPVTTAQKTEVGFTVAGSGIGSAIGEAVVAAISRDIALSRSIFANRSLDNRVRDSDRTVGQTSPVVCVAKIVFRRHSKVGCEISAPRSLSLG